MPGPVRARRDMAVVVGVTCLLLTGCSTKTIQVRNTIAPEEQPTPVVATTGAWTGDPTTQPSDAGVDPTVTILVSRVAVQTDDLSGTGLVIKPVPGGDQVAGHASLQNCGHRFASEQHRVARHALTLATSSGDDSGLGNEVIAYRSADQAEQALQEWRGSVTACSKGSQAGLPETGTPRVRYESETTASDSALPVPENTVTTAVMTLSTTKARRYELVVLQQRGAVLDVVRLSRTSPLQRGQISQAMSLATATGRRLVTG